MSAVGRNVERRWEDPYRLMADLGWFLLIMGALTLATLLPFWPWK